MFDTANQRRDTAISIGSQRHLASAVTVAMPKDSHPAPQNANLFDINAKYADVLCEDEIIINLATFKQAHMDKDKTMLTETIEDGKTVEELLFTKARTYNKWHDKPVSDEQIHHLYELMKMAPTSGNCCPGHFVFIRSHEGKERLKPALSRGNTEKTMTAPVTVIVAYDEEFYEKLPYLFPHNDARSWFTSSPALAHETAFRNGSLQGAYLIMAARSMGLDCGPMSGFKNEIVDEAFFAGTKIKSNFLVNIGYGDISGTFDRLPRLSFDEAATLA